MQPCTVCGAVTISATGHCTQCGTYRGFPPVDPANAPTYGAPPTAAMYPSAGHPGSGAPAYPPQPAGHPGYPGYPAPPGPPPPNRSRPFVVPLVALSITLVVLVVAIVIVVVVRGEQDPPVTAPTASPTPTGNPDVDPCVVGRWVVTRHRESVPIPEVGDVMFNGGRDSSMDLEADGTGVMTYPAGTAYEGSANGRTIKLEITGEVTFEYAARNETMSLRNLRAAATAVAFVDGAEVGRDKLTPDTDPANYSCLDDTLTISTTRYTTDFSKSG
ncbi:MAG TPA: hypothetical protein VFT95_15085 [Micromonosporaceae bacterium]|nr:hypothetical protein [Micromonosporaceae bacterium]